MSIDNQVSITLTPEQQSTLLAQLDALTQGLAWTLSLSSTDRLRLSKAAAGTEPFINQALELARQAPDALPRSFSIEEFEKDVATRSFLLTVQSRLATLSRRVDDTVASCGSEAFQASLTVYNTFKTYGDDLAVDAQLQEMAKRFKRSSRATSGAAEG